MTAQVRLRGYADTVGKSIGFLIPVFDREGSNALLVQRISSDGTILDFEEVDSVEAQITYIDPEPVGPGQEAVWAFGFGPSDIVAGPASIFRETLGSRLDDRVLAERPLLSVEVAEFLRLPKRRLEFANLTLARLSESKPKAARAWLDLSILTPDLRRELGGNYPNLGARLNRVVAAIEGNQVIIRGLPLSGGTDSLGFQFEEATRNVLRRLDRVYAAPRDGWKIRLEVSDNAKRRTPAPEAVVWLVDRADSRAQSFIQDDFSWRVDAYRADELEEFREAATNPESAAFAVGRSRDRSAMREVEQLVDAKLTTIQFESLSRVRSTSQELYRSRSPRARIVVPIPGLPSAGTSSKTIATTVRQIVAASLEIQENGLLLAPEGDWLFVRAIGTGWTRHADAWANLYDRIATIGLSARRAYSITGSGSSSRQEHSESARDILFPSAQPLLNRRTISELDKSRTDAALFLPIEWQAEDDWKGHSERIEAALSYRGWQSSAVSNGHDQLLLKLDTPGQLRNVLLERDQSMGRPSWDISHLLSIDLEELNTVVVMSEAGPAAILGRLSYMNQLSLTVRDILGGSAESGIWSLLGSQLRRFASGQLSRGRSHFASLLIHHAFKRSRIDLDEAGALYDAIFGPTLGKEVHLTWTRVRQTPKETRALVRLVAGHANDYAPSGTDLIQPFWILLHANGVVLFRNYGAATE